VSLYNDELSDFDKELLLTNIIGIQTIDELTIIERKITSVKEFEIRQNGIKGDFDYAHLKLIHKKLKGNIKGYEFIIKKHLHLGGY